jgi:hypothetical protein
MKQQLNESKRMQQLAGIFKESQLNEETFLSKMEKLNPGYSKESVLADFEDEYEKQDDWGDIDVSGDYEDHQEYLKDAEDWFNKVESTGPTVKVGDSVKVYAKSVNKQVFGKIVKDIVMKGSHGFEGDIKPNKIPGWWIQCYKDPNMTQKIGTLAYPQFEEGISFEKIDTQNERYQGTPSYSPGSSDANDWDQGVDIEIKSKIDDKLKDKVIKRLQKRGIDAKFRVSASNGKNYLRVAFAGDDENAGEELRKLGIKYY